MIKKKDFIKHTFGHFTKSIRTLDHLLTILTKAGMELLLKQWNTTQEETSKR